MNFPSPRYWISYNKFSDNTHVSVWTRFRAQDNSHLLGWYKHKLSILFHFFSFRERLSTWASDLIRHKRNCMHAVFELAEHEMIFRFFFGWNENTKREFSETKQRKWNLILIYFYGCEFSPCRRGFSRLQFFFCHRDRNSMSIYCQNCRMAKQINQMTLPKTIN